MLDISTEPLDSESENMAGYYYGKASLVVLRLNCEYTFFKFNSKYVDAKPEAVKEFIVNQKGNTSTRRSTGSRGSGSFRPSPSGNFIGTMDDEDDEF